MADRTFGPLLSLLACGALLSGCGETPTAKPQAAKTPARPAVAHREVAPPPAAAGKPCAPAETLVYACALKGGRLVSVCAGEGALTYRIGSASARELTLVGRPGGSVHVGTVRGGGSGFQTAIRFTNQAYDYIVWSAVYGELTEVAGQHASGVVVEKDGEVVSQLSCAQTGPDQQIHDIPEWVPEETEEGHLAWY